MGEKRILRWKLGETTKQETVQILVCWVIIQKLFISSIAFKDIFELLKESSAKTLNNSTLTILPLYKFVVIGEILITDLLIANIFKLS